MMRNMCKVLGMITLLLLPVQAIAFFEVSGNYAVGTNPVSLTSADFDGDGNMDLAVANRILSPYISVLFGKGDGTFNLAVDRASGMNAIAIASADFNGDGKMDIVTVGYFSPTGGLGMKVHVLLGVGDGTFQAPISFSTGGGANNVAVGDLNNDGNMDLAVTNEGLPFLDSVGVLLGNGDGTFLPVTNYTAGTYPDSVSLIDLSGDGNIDMVVTNRFSQNVTFFLGTGSGGFSSVSSYTTGIWPGSISGGDFNGDGNLDMVVTNTLINSSSKSGMTIFPGTAGGSFDAGLYYTIDGVSYGVVVDDFNSDGTMDIIIAGSGISAVRVILGVGNGTFLIADEYGDGSKSPIAVVKADFNHDGKLDLALANLGSNDVSVLLNKYQIPVSPPSSSSSPPIDSSGSSGGCLMPNNYWQGMLAMLMLGLMLLGFYSQQSYKRESN